MSFALKYGSLDRPDMEVGLIYFDAVTQYGRDFSGQVSSHPLANGSQISDHFTRQNPKYNLSAVISGVDISTWTYLIRDSEGLLPQNTYDNESVSITAPDEGLMKYVPDVIGQFFEPEDPTVVFDTARTDYTPQVEASLIKLMEGFVYDADTSFWRSNVQLVTLYEFDGVLMKNMIPNLVVTNMRFQEDTNSGDALVVSMSLEQVTFSYLQRIKLDAKVTKSLSDQAASEEKKSSADSTEAPVADYDISTTTRTSERLLYEEDAARGRG